MFVVGWGCWPSAGKVAQGLLRLGLGLWSVSLARWGRLVVAFAKSGFALLVGGRQLGIVDSEEAKNRFSYCWKNNLNGRRMRWFSIGSTWPSGFGSGLVDVLGGGA